MIKAIADGRRAAISINQYLSGENLRLAREVQLKAIKEPRKGKYDRAARAQMHYLEPKKRVKNFNEVQKGLTKSVTVQEAKRCISCGTCCMQTRPYDVMQFNQEFTKAVECDLCVEINVNVLTADEEEYCDAPTGAATIGPLLCRV